MPSLKDLRNRIASTKATQKITKAMQMVAASKLRRAQAAAEAARPSASHMDTVLGNIAASVAGLDNAPRAFIGRRSHTTLRRSAGIWLNWAATVVPKRLVTFWISSTFMPCSAE